MKRIMHAVSVSSLILLAACVGQVAADEPSHTVSPSCLEQVECLPRAIPGEWCPAPLERFCGPATDSGCHVVYCCPATR